jgi:hypothetical protein
MVGNRSEVAFKATLDELDELAEVVFAEVKTTVKRGFVKLLFNCLSTVWPSQVNMLEDSVDGDTDVLRAANRDERIASLVKFPFRGRGFKVASCGYVTFV